MPMTQVAMPDLRAASMAPTAATSSRQYRAPNPAAAHSHHRADAGRGVERGVLVGSAVGGEHDVLREPAGLVRRDVARRA